MRLPGNIQGTPSPEMFLSNGHAGPVPLPYLGLWLDAADPATVLIDGSSKVLNWKDKSGYTRNLLQATTAKRPTFAVSPGNNRVIFSNAGGTFLQTASFTWARPISMYFAMKPTTWAYLRNFCDGCLVTDSLSFAQYQNGPSELTIYAGTVLTGAGPAPGARIIAAAIFNGASSKIRINGAQIASGNSGSGAQPNGLTLGAGDSGLGRNIDCEFNEVLCYNAGHTTGESQVVESYLTAHWPL